MNKDKIIILNNITFLTSFLFKIEEKTFLRAIYKLEKKKKFISPTHTFLISLYILEEEKAKIFSPFFSFHFPFFSFPFNQAGYKSVYMHFI